MLYRLLCPLMIVGGMFGGGIARAEVSQEVKDVLEPALKRSHDAQALRVVVNHSGAIKINDRSAQEFASSLKFQSAVPNKLSVEATQQGETSVPLVCDGEKCFYRVNEEAFLRLPAPETLDNMAEEMLIGFGPIDMVILPLATVGNEAAAVLYEGIEKSSVVDREKVGERTAAHVRLEDKETVWDLWVATDEKPEVLKLEADLSQNLREQNPQLAAAQKVEFLVKADFSKWEFDPSLAADAFAFKAPEGATGYDSVAELQKAMQGPPPLLGEEAPGFQLATLEGGTFDFNKHKGKDVVLLDFWATWCGPCRAGLPIVAEVTQSLADQGVVAYAVNLQETAEDVQGFLKESKLQIPVAMDIEGEVSSAFKVEGIPHTVLIGKDGKVQAVHIGFGNADEYRKQLTDELKALLAGESLLEEGEPKPAAEQK